MRNTHPIKLFEISFCHPPFGLIVLLGTLMESCDPDESLVQIGFLASAHTGLATTKKLGKPTMNLRGSLVCSAVQVSPPNEPQRLVGLLQ